MSNGTITKLTKATVALGATLTQPTLDLLAAMGHGNGSGATEEFTNVPGMPRVLNAANFGDPADSDETKINALIAAASAAGATTSSPYIGFIPFSMLPYGVSSTTADSSHVLHNTAVHMVREGGSPTLDEYDVKAYGAAGNASNDDFHAIEACVLAANAQSEQGGILTLRFPPGRYFMSQPLWTRRGSGLRLVGSAQGVNTQAFFGQGGVSSIELNCAGGPAVLVSASNQSVIGLGTSLVTGSGNSWDSSAGNNQWFNFRDLPITLNGLSAFTAECFYQSTYTNAADRSSLIYSSGGVWNSNTAFRLFRNLSNTLSFSVTSSNGEATATGTTMAEDGITRHIAGTWDGTTISLWVNGVVEGTAPLTGTMVQKIDEEVIAGAFGFQVGEQNLTSHGPRGKLSSVRLSKTCRYTVNFTPPTSEFAPDSNTIVLTNFEAPRGPMVKCYTTSTAATATGWLVQRDLSNSLGSVSAFHADGVGFGSSVGGGNTSIFLRDHVTHWSIDRCNFENFNRAVFKPAGGNGFDWSLTRSAFHGSPSTQRLTLVLNAYTGIGAIRDCWLWGGPYPIIVSAGGVSFENVFLQAETDSICAGVFMGLNVSAAPVSLRGVFFNTESGVSADFLATWLIKGGSSATGATFANCVFENTSTKPFVMTSGTVQRLVFRETNFNTVGTQPSSVVSIASGTPGTPILFDHCYQEDAWIPWTDVAGTAKVTAVGKLSAVAYSATPTFDCSVRDEFEITLTGDCAPTITNVTPGQSILVTIIQDGAGAHGFTWPANVKGGGTVSATGGSVNQQRFTAMLDSATNPTLMADAAMVSV